MNEYTKFFDELLSREHLKDFIYDLINEFIDAEQNIYIENNGFNEKADKLFDFYKTKLKLRFLELLERSK